MPLKYPLEQPELFRAEPMVNYPHIARMIAETPLAMDPRKWVDVYGFLLEKFSGTAVPMSEIQARINPEAQAAPRRETKGEVAVLSLRGTIAHRAESVDNVSGPGGTSTEKFGRRFDAAVRDDNVRAILLDVDSPGGAVPGVQELADQIHGARNSGKPVVASVNSLAASAAYWIASQTDQIAMTPSGEVGSIGVFGAHEDISGWMEKRGIKTTLISAGEFKTEGNPFEPLTASAREHLQSRVDAYYDDFVGAVARGRVVSRETVLEGFGQGRVFGARDALVRGMVDRIETFDETLGRLQAGDTPQAPEPASSAEFDDWAYALAFA